MTTYTTFTPNSLAPFSFNPTLDGQVYAATVTWNVFGQRWYLNVTQLDGTPVFTLPLIGSPPILTLEALSWANGTVTATTSTPHGFLPLTTTTLVVSGCSPAVYNGTVEAFVTGADTFTYPLSTIPGTVTALGSAAYNINLAAGYFQTSTLVYRQDSGQFEVTP